MNSYSSYKDSGVEWIGEIPRDWKLLKFWLIISSSDLGGNYNCSSEYEGYPVMKITMANLENIPPLRPRSNFGLRIVPYNCKGNKEPRWFRSQ